MNHPEINKRYSSLAESTCCLSCGGAINHAGPAPGEICVDLGSGRGTDAMRMAEAVGKEGFVYGVDIAEGMLLKAKNTALKLGINNVMFIQRPLERTGLPDGLADVVISNCAINHAEDKQAVWNEVFRILKRNGRFVVSDIYALQPVAEAYRNDPVAVAECWAGAVTRDVYLRQLELAGFSNVNIIEESVPYAKGKIAVASWTLSGEKGCSCRCQDV